MLETQIKVKIDAFSNFFPIYLRIVAKSFKIKIRNIKRYKDSFSITTHEDGDKIYLFLENLYNFGNLFNIQTIKFDYKPLAK